MIMKENRIIMDEEAQATCSNTKILLTATLWIFVAIAIGILLATESVLLFIIVCVLIAKIERYWNKKFNAFLIPRWMVGYVKETTLFRVFIMALSQQWALCILILNAVVLVFTHVSVEWFFDPPRTLAEMNMESGYIEKIKEGKPGRRSSNRDYLFMQTGKGELLKLYSIYMPEQLEKLRRAKNNNEKVTFWYQDNFGLLNGRDGRIREIKTEKETIQRYNEPLDRRLYNQNKKALSALTIYLLATYGFIAVFFYRKLKQQKVD